jgi:hypothetical protein
MCYWECAASIAERAITTVLLLPRASTFWKRLPVKGEAWKALVAEAADQECSIHILAVRSVRSERVQKTGGMFIVASAPSSLVIRSELFRAMAEFTTAMYSPISRS